MPHVDERTDAVVRANAYVTHPEGIDHPDVLHVWVACQLVVIRSIAQHSTTETELHMRRRVSESRVSCQMCFEVAQC